MRRHDAIARWYRSRISPSRVSGHSSRWVMNTSTEYMPTASVPLSAAAPPTTRVMVKPIRIAMRISGMKALDSRIASPLTER